jgi:thiol-disulfide isomerase/thioredoxin
MKNAIIFTVLLSGFFIPAMAQHPKGRFTINGKITGVQTGLVYLYYANDQNKRIKDSAAILDGKFRFLGDLSEPTMAYMQLKEEKRTQNNSANFFIEPVTITALLTLDHFPEGKFTGSKVQEEYAAVESKKMEIQKRWKVVMDTLTAVNKRSNVQFQELKDWVLQPYNAEMDNLDFSFFKDHPQSYLTAYLLRFHVSELPLDSLQMFYDKLGKQVQQATAGKDLAEEIQKIRSGSPGSVAADFNATDIQGQPLHLSDFKGKYVLLDFWASWCVPCRKGNPHLKELYAKYHEKGIEFIGVSDDDRNPTAWHKAVETDGLPWRHVLRGLNMEKLLNKIPNPGDISEKFGIQSLPTKILIDPEGKIVGRYSEEEGPLDAKLSSIFGF